MAMFLCLSDLSARSDQVAVLIGFKCSWTFFNSVLLIHLEAVLCILSSDSCNEQCAMS